jgi:hypothetical protein
MNPYPGFTVRTYPAFRAARLYRVFVAPDALYFIRMKGLISVSDAGSGLPIDPLQAAVAAVIRWFGRKTMESSREQVERCDPEEMVRSSKKHFKLAADDLVTSSLEPPSLLGGHGHHYARWKVAAPGLKQTFQIEDADSLQAALDRLPGVLGPRLTVKVDPPYGGDRVRSRIMG